MDKKNSTFLRYYQSAQRPAPRPPTAQDLMARVRRKKAELQDSLQARSLLSCGTSQNLTSAQIDDMRRTDSILRGGSTVVRRQHSPDFLLTDGTSDTEIIHGPPAPRDTVAAEVSLSISKSTQAARYRDSSLLGSRVAKYREQLLSTDELSARDLKRFQRSLGRVSVVPHQVEAEPAPEADSLLVAMDNKKESPLMCPADKTPAATKPYEEDSSLRLSPAADKPAPRTVHTKPIIRRKQENDAAVEIRRIVREELGRAMDGLMERLDAKFGVCLKRTEEMDQVVRELRRELGRVTGKGKCPLGEWTNGRAEEYENV